jgi:hypothetical protein
MAITYEVIATETVASSTQFITFSSIPQTFTDIILVTDGLSQPAGGGSVFVKVNGDTPSTNYSSIYMFGTGSGVSGGTGDGFATNRHNATALEGGNGHAHFMNYANTTTYKTVVSNGGGNNISISFASTWRSTAAITSMRLQMESGPGFLAGFKATLFGIKAA